MKRVAKSFVTGCKVGVFSLLDFPLSASARRVVMEVHPSRMGLVPGSRDDRPRAADAYDDDGDGRRQRRGDSARSRSPPPHMRQHHGDRGASNRRPSPSYDNYNNDRAGPDGRYASNGDRRDNDNDDEERRRREAWMRGDDLRRNQQPYDSRGPPSRRTPERELGYGGGGGGGRPGYGRGPPRGGEGGDFFES